MSRQYFEHDDRGGSGPSKIYSRGGYSAMGRNRKFRDSPGYNRRRVDFDGDVEMSANSAPIESRFVPYSHRGQHNHKHGCRKHGGRSKFEKDHKDNNGISWYKISIPHGRKTGKMFILKSITSLCKVPFVPYNFQFQGNSAEFYVNDISIANHIKDVNRRVTNPDGFKLIILMTRCGAPPTPYDKETTDILKNCLSSHHYRLATHTLDLSKLYASDSLKLNGLYLPLYKPTVVGAVTSIIKEHIPDLRTLILSDNKMVSLDGFGVLVPVCKQLKSISLSNNRLKVMSELNHLKGLELEELVLDGNPLCDDFNDKVSYISAVREKFPKLLRLDGHDLPPPIGFDLGTETIPVSKKSFFAAEDVKDIVILFLDQYYSIYDSGDRTKLLDAYHDQACFSLTLSRHGGKNNQGSLGVYLSENRNILRVISNTQRFKLLKQGKLAVVNTLQDLPQTMHDPTSFSVDIFHVSPGLMSFSVLGVFKEVGPDINKPTVKTFSRTFVVVPQGTGFVIVNETLYIDHASSDQTSKAFKVIAPTPSPSPAPTEEKAINEKQLLVMELSKQTGMNLEFSTKCLEENDWDFQRSLAVFMKFQSEGKLPPEAFITLG